MSVPRLVQPGNHTYNTADHFRFSWNVPSLRRTARKRMWLHQQAGAILMKPSASVTVSNFDKIHGPVVFVGPIVVFHASRADIHENHTARTQQWHHSPIRQTNVAVPLVGISIRKYTF